MPSSQTLISVAEYLAASYSDGDREYIEGRVVERNLGEKGHSRVQKQLIVFFAAREKTVGTFCFPEQRVQVKRDRFRVPDVCVYIGQEPDEEVFTTPPFLVVEILSPRDTASSLQNKVEEYLSFGVPFVWVIDPASRRGYIHTADGSRPAKDGVLRTAGPEIETPLASLFPA
ncbi:MAG: Uma2 family endonuclease [Bryobacteraceae bacterium]